MFVKKLFKKKVKEKKSLIFTHHWTLDNFVHLYDGACQWKWEVAAEEFSVPKNEELKFCLRIKAKEKGDDGKEYLEVGLCTREMPAMWEGQVTVEERYCIVDEKGRELWCREYAEREVFQDTCTGDDYLLVKKLFDSSAGYLRRGTLRVLCELTLHSPEAIFNSAGNAHTFSSTCIPSSVSSLSHSLTLSHFKWLTRDSTRQMPLKVESQYFAPHREDCGKLKLEFFPEGREGNDEENVEIAILSENTDSLLVHFEFALLDAKGDKCHQHDDTERFHPNNSRSYSVLRRHLLSLLDSLPTDELTINCHVTILVKEEQDGAPYHPTPTPTTSHLDLALFTYHYVSYTWTIDRFYAQLHRDCIDSNFFSPSTDSRYTFNLRLYPEEDSENVTLELGFAPTFSIEESTVNWRYSVMGATEDDLNEDELNEDEWNCQVYSHLISKRAQFGPYELISHRTLDNFADFLLLDDRLIIECELWIHEPRKELPPELLNPQANGAISSLSSGVTQLHISHVNLTNSILASQSTINTGNINNSLSSTTDEPSQHK